MVAELVSPAIHFSVESLNDGESTMTTTSDLSTFLDRLKQISRYDTLTLEQTLDTIRWELRNRPDTDYMSVVWSTADVHYCRPDLTVDQCREVLKALDDSHNAEYGINWSLIEHVAATCYAAPDHLDELREQAYPDGLY